MQCKHDLPRLPALATCPFHPPPNLYLHRTFRLLCAHRRASITDLGKHFASHRMTRGPVYEESCLDGVEDIERYQTGGFHPIAPAHVIGGDRYRIVHKLGAGGISTVWLARDLTARDDKDSALGRLVCLKVLRADQSPTHCEDAADVAIPKAVASLNPAIHNRLLIADKCFIERGPNGSHLCVASDVAGPNLASIFECPGRVIGNRRLRAEYSRRVAKQVTEFVHEMHSAGYAHGGQCRLSLG
jgi:serine/threonine-protein kinase SRPK3